MSSRITCVLLGACVLAASGGPAEAQIGGFLKKKAKEAAQAPVKQAEAKQQSDEAAAQALTQPDIVPITSGSTARFRKALGIEARLRGEFKTLLASLKTQDEYRSCQGEVMMSPEAQKISMRVAELPDNASMADMQKLMTKSGADLEALVLKRCGGDPGKWNEGRRAERLREIEGEASDAFAPPAVPEPEGDGADGVRSGPSAPAAARQAADTHPYRRQYAMAKERWIPFCNALATAPEATGKGKYATVKGVGSGVYVYSSEEAAVMASSCVEVMSDINATLQSVGGARLP